MATRQVRYIEYIILGTFSYSGDGPLDVGLIRFAENISSVEAARELWKEVGKLAFNSSTYFKSP